MGFYMALLLFALFIACLTALALKGEKVRKAKAEAEKPKKRYY